jgi:mRNA interferase RelE/StbE
VWTVQFVRSAEKELYALPGDVARATARKLDQLATDPYAAGLRKMSGRPERWRARIGDYRIVVTLDQAEQVITVLRIRHRRDVYR